VPQKYIPCVGSNNVAVVVVSCPIRPIRVTAAVEVGNGTNVLILERRSVKHCVTTNGHLILVIEPFCRVVEELPCTDRIPPFLDSVGQSISFVAVEIGAVPGA
jgi:hypothetical protein